MILQNLSQFVFVNLLFNEAGQLFCSYLINSMMMMVVVMVPDR